MQISIVIPTYNVEKHIEKVLTSILNQEREITINHSTINFQLEIITIDSSSTDSTLKILKQFNSQYPKIVKIIKIPKKEFHHSKTRNLGAKLSRGQIIIFLNADAVPVGKSWLINLVKKIISSEVAATFSRQIPPKNIPLPEYVFLLHTYSPVSATIHRGNWQTFFSERHILFSTVSCAVKREVFELVGGFDEELDICEDQEFAFRLINNGFKIAYCAESRVIHGHNLEIPDLIRRYLKFGRAYAYIIRKYKVAREKFDITYYFKSQKNIVLNSIKLLKLKKLPLTKNIPYIFVYNIFKSISYLIGSKIL